MDAPLRGLRVLELATGVAGPYACRLLALLGAEVKKLEPAWGDPARNCPVDDAPLKGPSPLFLHLNAGKSIGSRTTETIRDGLEWAHVVVNDRTRFQIDETELVPEELAGRFPRLVYASVTPWGFEALETGGVHDELLVQARSGIMTVTGDPGAAPLRFPGWQSQYMAGAYTAAAALASLHDGAFHHVDVAWLSAMAAGTEAGLQRFLSTGHELPPAGARSLRTFPSGAWSCADGHVVPGTVRRKDWQLQCELYGMPELVRDERFKAAALRGQNHQELASILQPWYDAHPKRDIFESALPLGLALGMVVTASDALGDVHMRERRFLGRFELDGTAFVAPRSLCVTREADASTPPRRATGRLLEGVRVVELCTAWAGPFIGRFLGALGADVVKVESARQVDGWRMPMRTQTAMKSVPEGLDPELVSHDVAPNFNTLNRNKRGIAVDLTREEGREILLKLVADADVVTANYTERVLPNLRLTYEDLRAVKPDVILLNMPALGASGPYKALAGYGTIIEGMGGFASRFGYVHEGARVSDTYYPDAVAGVHATIAVLAALRRRQTTGAGTSIDMSQQEVMWMQLGEAIVHTSIHGQDPGRMGNAEPGCPGSGVYACADGRHVAIVPRDATEVDALSKLVGDGGVAHYAGALESQEVVERLAVAGVGVAPVNGYAGASEDDVYARIDAFETVVHPVTGAMSYLRLPVRIDGSSVTSGRPAPRFDEHTDDVLRELGGATIGALARLRTSGVIGGEPTGPARG